jgi:hypothetical protein
MATKILLKHGLGAPSDSDISGAGELAIDIQNRVIYTKDDNGNVIMLGADISSETIDWSQLENIPTEFPPEPHDHEYAEVNNGSGKTLETEIADILQHLQDLDTELGALQGQLTFGGTVDISTDSITAVTDAATDKGFSVGPIPNPPPGGSENIYFICEKGGTFDGGTYNSGDWLVSEGGAAGWTGVHFDATVSVMWDEVGGKPTEFPPEAHTHEIDDINNLQDALDNLAADGHTHEIDDINGLSDELDLKASIVQISGGTY